MKITAAKRILALLLCLALAACSASESTDGADSAAADETVSAGAGGAVTLPEGFAAPEASNTIATQLSGEVLAGAFTLTNYRTTGYFTTGGTVTVTVQATLETGGIDTKWTDATFSLWKQGESTTEYMGTVHFTADGTPYTYTFSGLEAGAQYRVAFTYSDVPKYKLSGSFNIAGVTAQDAEEMETAEA